LHKVCSYATFEMWIPPGFAHGFLVTSKHAEFLYKTTNYWEPEYQRCIG